MRMIRAIAFLLTLVPLVLSAQTSKSSAADSGGSLRLDDEASRRAVDDLMNRSQASNARPMESLHFGGVPLTRPDAERAREVLRAAHDRRVKADRSVEVATSTVAAAGKTMKYFKAVYGEPDRRGRSLYISMHGGGASPASVNDAQWKNQRLLYRPAEGVYVAPRAPSDTWNLWHEAHIDPLFERLIETLVAIDGVDPDRVYLMGYSAGGDGVYQLAPRLADRFAAAAMMAGHPNETRPDGLRNLPFAIHVGADDAAFGRNAVAESWRKALGDLNAADPKGYVFRVDIHPGKGHWMDREDASAVPWMAKFRRNLRPERIVWLQDDVVHRRFYWLSVDDAKPGERIVASRRQNTIRIDAAPANRKIVLLLDDDVVDLDRPIRVQRGDRIIHEGRCARTIDAMEATLGERGDVGGIFFAALPVPE